MSQSFIDSLMHFFSLLFLPLPGKRVSHLRPKLEDYFEKAAIIFPVDKCLKIYNNYSSRYFFEFSGRAYDPGTDVYNIRKHLIHEAAIKARGNLYLQERLLLVLALLEFTEVYFPEDDFLKSSIHDLSRSLNLSEEDFSETQDFIRSAGSKNTDNELHIEETSGMNEELEGVWVDEQKKELERADEPFTDRIRGRLVFHYFRNFNYLVFRISTDQKIFLNETQIYPGFFYSFKRKDILRFEGLNPIYYNEIENIFHIERPPVISLTGKDISYRYNNSSFSIKSFSFSEDSGQLIGIIGNNGVGKSSILKLISNNVEPASGRLCINGADLSENRYKLSSTLAFIPQEDLIIPELSVYENLLFQAHLTMGRMNSKELHKRVAETIDKLGLSDIARLKADAGQMHRINDFKRICLRIAIELIRNPYVIFLDEPLDSLSWSDSRRIISILKDEAYQGKLIFLTSQIPTAEIYNMFDKVWLIDQDGYMIYSGEPSRSLNYFRETGLLPYYYIQSDSTQLSAEDVVKVIETKKINPDGSVSDERQVSPGTWYDAWKSGPGKVTADKNQKSKPVPVLSSNQPGIEKQFLIYLIRNFRIKFKKVSYLLLNFIGIPAVAVILTWAIRLLYGEYYTLSENEYIPLYLFISVNFILFAGLLTGAEEIYRERPLIHRDNYLYLSIFSYKNSKIVYLFFVSLIQVFLYTLAGNLILGIRGMLPVYLFTFFSLAVFANLLSLSLSAAIKKLNNIYIVIPFLLIPNLLFSGFLIRYDNYTRTDENDRPIPLVAEFIPSRWAYEALVFEQFANNPFNRNFFRQKKDLYESEYILEHVIPQLYNLLNRCDSYASEEAQDSLKNCLGILYNELRQLSNREGIAPFEKINLVRSSNYDRNLYNDIYGYLTYAGFLMESKISEATENILETEERMRDSLGSFYQSYQLENQNRFIESLLTTNDHKEYIIPGYDKLIKRGPPVYLRPESPYGRAHFFAPEKKINNQYLPTLRFNLSVLWTINLLMYIIFLIDGIKYLLRFFSPRM